jgi:hypothetical protein
MGGGLLQLVAYGAQDIYLSGNPQITFFKAVYRRHTNFSLESIEQTFNGTVNFGKKVTCTISRNGDLINRMYLKCDLPAINVKDTAGVDPKARWVDHIGHALINSVEIEIGGQKIDKHYGEWLHIWNELTQTAGHAFGYGRMIGNHPIFTDSKSDLAAIPKVTTCVEANTLYIPLQFWFCRNPGLALPLIALQYHEVKINFEFRDANELVVFEDPNYVIDGELGATLYVDYVYLDTDERRRFAQVTHEYLIEQLQFTGSESIPMNQENVKIKLNFNHPVKELVWTVRDNANLSSRALLPNEGPSNYDNFNYAVNAAWAAPGALGVDGVGAGGNDLVRSSALYGGRNPTQTAKLQLNAHDRFSLRDGLYFNVVQPYQHHENVPPVGINVYSFALKPEDHQPSGSCNMSRIDNATLQLQLEKMATGAQVSVYATNYNVLRIMSGMGGLAYASIAQSISVSATASIGSKMMSLMFTGFTHAFGR